MSSIQIHKIDPGTSERKLLGQPTHDQLDFPVNHLEEEFEQGAECCISLPALDYFRIQGAGDGLLSLRIWRWGTASRLHARGDGDRLFRRPALTRPS